jgi:hypothetical protein
VNSWFTAIVSRGATGRGGSFYNTAQITRGGVSMAISEQIEAAARAETTR